uniref:Uncharacterized protein n=2 Tax=Caenorhabditis japonica TaxID=281687 RepID=A0A8R1HT49_CAEJA
MVSRNPPLSLIMKNNFSGPGKLEWLARFMVSHGVPYEALYETSFRKFLREYVPNLVIPLPSAMESVVNRIGEHGVQVIPAEVDEISVTFDIFGDEDEGHKCIAFSVHYSPWVYGFGARRNIVYLRKLDDGPLSAQRIIEFIREAINKDQQKYLKIANIVIPNRKLAALFNMKNAVIKHTICFNHCVDTFVTEVLQIEEIAATIEKYREIVKSIRTNEELFVEFKRYLNGIGAPSDLPSYRKDGWRSVSAFAARCLELNDVITHLSFDVDTLSEQLLNFVHKMLEKCSQYSGYISQSGSSISQVIPTILLIKHEMKRQIDGLPPEETVKSIFSEIFMPLTSGEQRQQYDLASLLDPRFAYRSALYTEEEWDDIEKTLLVEF